jgi:hypothetical protein
MLSTLSSRLPSVCLAIVCSVGFAQSAWGLTEAEYDTALTGIDAFLDRQMDRFTPVPNDYPAQFSDAQLIQTYDVPVADPSFNTLYHRADIYDTALAAIYYTRRGNLDRARRLLDGIRYVQQNDPITDPVDPSIGDGRLRTAYWANDLLAPNRQSPSIDSFNAAVGNNAWAGIALTHYYRETGQQAYLDSAKRAADWIIDNTQQSDADGFGGYSLGLDAVGNPIAGTTQARSTEHNIDVFSLAKDLAALDGDPKWGAMAQHAMNFVQATFNNQPGQEKYWTGTKSGAGGQTEPNYFPVPVDTQTWTALAGIDAPQRLDQVIRWIADTPANDIAGLKVSDDMGDGRVFDGLRFSTGGQRVQVEATGGYALAVWEGTQAGWLVDGPGDPAGRWPDELQGVLEHLDAIRTSADGSDPAGIGLVATPWAAGAPTGFGGDYPNLRHVASSVWTGLALLASHPDPAKRNLLANPLAELTPRLAGDLDDDGFVGIVDLNIVLGNWNQNVSPGDPLAGDPTGDGFVGIGDLNIVLGNWNSGVPPKTELSSVVPEPATVCISLLGWLGMISHQRGLWR